MKNRLKENGENPIRRFFIISNTFMSNAKLKLAKELSKS